MPVITKGKLTGRSIRLYDDRWLVKNTPNINSDQFITAKQEESIGVNNTVTENFVQPLHAARSIDLSGFDLNGPSIPTPPAVAADTTRAENSSVDAEPNIPATTPAVIPPMDAAAENTAVASATTTTTLETNPAGLTAQQQQQQSDVEANHRSKLYESMRKIRQLQHRREQCNRDLFNLETMYLDNPTFVGNVVDGYDLTSMLAKAQRLYKTENILSNTTNYHQQQQLLHLHQQQQQQHHPAAIANDANAESRTHFVNVFGNPVILPDEPQHQRSRSPIIRDTDRIFSSLNPNFNHQYRKWKTNVELYRAGKLAQVIAASLVPPVAGGDKTAAVKDGADNNGAVIDSKRGDKSHKNKESSSKRGLSKKSAESGGHKRTVPLPAAASDDQQPAKKKKRTKQQSLSEIQPVVNSNGGSSATTSRKKSSLSHSSSTLPAGNSLTLKLEDEEAAAKLRNDADYFLNDADSDEIALSRKRKKKHRKATVEPSISSLSPENATNTNHSGATLNDYDDGDDINADADYMMNEADITPAGGGGGSSGKKKKKKKTKKKDKKDDAEKPSDRSSKTSSKNAASSSKSSHNVSSRSKHSSKTSKKSLASHADEAKSSKSHAASGHSSLLSSTASPTLVSSSKSTKKLQSSLASSTAVVPATGNNHNKAIAPPPAAHVHHPGVASSHGGRKVAPTASTSALLTALTSPSPNRMQNSTSNSTPQLQMREFITPTIHMPTINTSKQRLPPPSSSSAVTNVLKGSTVSPAAAAAAAAKTNGQRKNSIPSSTSSSTGGSGSQSVIMGKNLRSPAPHNNISVSKQQTKYSVVTTNHNSPAPAMPLIPLGRNNTNSTTNSNNTANTAAGVRRLHPNVGSPAASQNHSSTNNLAHRSELASVLLAGSSKKAPLSQISQHITRQQQPHVFAVPRPATTASGSSTMPPILPAVGSFAGPNSTSYVGGSQNSNDSVGNYAGRNSSDFSPSAIVPPSFSDNPAAPSSISGILPRRLSSAFSSSSQQSPVNNNSSSILGNNVVYAGDSDSNDSSDAGGGGSVDSSGRRTRGRPRRGNILDIATERIRQRDG